MFGSLIQYAENDRLRTVYVRLRAKFASLIDVVEQCADLKQGYQGVEITARNKVNFTLCFFDRIIVKGEFSGAIEGKKQQMLGRIVFSQDGSVCRTYYFDEFENIFDLHGHKIEEGNLFDVKLASHMLTEICHNLIDDGVAFETVKLWG